MHTPITPCLMVYILIYALWPFGAITAHNEDLIVCLDTYILLEADEYPPTQIL